MPKSARDGRSPVDVDAERRRPRFGRWVPGLALTLAALVLIRCGSTNARADGGMFWRTDRYIYERSQNAFIVYDPRAGRETLILRTSFETQTKDFAWVVPVPSLPEFEQASASLFAQAFEYTTALHHDRNLGCACLEEDEYATKAGAPGDVTIYDEQTVGIYGTSVIGAESSADLIDWLEEHGYLGDTNRFLVTEALQYYIDKDWYFVAMRIDSTALAGNPGAWSWYGNTQPISLTFDTEQAVLPMRISAISTGEAVDVYVYVSAPHRMTFPHARTEYANRIGSDELNYLKGRHPLVAQRVAEGSFLTRLRVSLGAADMANDIEIVRAANDGQFRRIDYGAFPWFEAALLAVAGVSSQLWLRRHGPRARRRA
jgi:hypothetical protein